MIRLTTVLSSASLELLHNGETLVEGIEVGPWCSMQQIRTYRRTLPGIQFYFHGSGLIERVGLVPGAVRRVAAYAKCTSTPWVSAHIAMWLPGVAWLALGHGWRMLLPHPDRATRRFIRKANRLAGAIRVPLILENTPPYVGYDFDARTERITEVLRETGCGFLLDTGHARVSAAALGISADDYVSSLPLDRVVQVHVSGPRMRDRRLVDAHDAMQAVDYELLDRLLARTHPSVVTLEYNSETEALREQLHRLRVILEMYDDGS